MRFRLARVGCQMCNRSKWVVSMNTHFVYDEEEGERGNVEQVGEKRMKKSESFVSKLR